MSGQTGYVTTHVLDTARGKPASGLQIDIFEIDGGTRRFLGSMTTNADGRCDGPVIPADTIRQGAYEFVFHAGAYLDRAGAPQSDGPRFLDLIPIRFAVSDASQHYHVPLLLSPFGYSTYRGS